MPDCDVEEGVHSTLDAAATISEQRVLEVVHQLRLEGGYHSFVASWLNGHSRRDYGNTHSQQPCVSLSLWEAVHRWS